MTDLKGGGGGVLSFQDACQLHVTLDGSCLKLNLNKRLGRTIAFAHPYKYNGIIRQSRRVNSCSCTPSPFSAHFYIFISMSTGFIPTSSPSCRLLLPSSSPPLGPRMSFPHRLSQNQISVPPPPYKFGLIRRKAPSPVLSKSFPL
jgi:hypothetical protein